MGVVIRFEEVAHGNRRVGARRVVRAVRGDRPGGGARDRAWAGRGPVTTSLNRRLAYWFLAVWGGTLALVTLAGVVERWLELP